jgi:hypothetical protein
MTLDELRETVFNEIGINLEQDLLTDSKLIQCWNQAVKYWLRYMNSVNKGGGYAEDSIGFTIDDSNEIEAGSKTYLYEFKERVPRSIKTLYCLPYGQTIPCWLYWYNKPLLTLKKGVLPGNYAAVFEGSANYAEMLPDDIPEYLLWLVCAYVKKKVGQFIKFASYNDKPFDVDGEAWYNEGEKWAKELEEFIRVNRDERESNLTDFNRNRRILAIPTFY